MDKSLIDYLKQIPAPRDPHGLRHPLWLVLLVKSLGASLAHLTVLNRRSRF